MHESAQTLPHAPVARGVVTAEAAARYRAAEAGLWTHHGGTMPAEHRMELETGRAVRVLEAGHGRPVLFVHGGPNAGSTWAPIAARMPSVRAIVLDRPGCGLSDPIDYDGVDVAAAMVEAQVAALERLADGPVDVVGSSFGGACALWLARARPDLVRRIVLEGVPGIAGMRLAGMLRLLAVGPIGRFIAGRPSDRTDLVRTFRQLGHGRLVASGWPRGADLDWSLAMMNDTATMRSEVALIQRGATWRGFRPGALFDPAELARVEAPTLWLLGDRDPFGTAELGRDWARAMPDATVEVTAGSGHLPWLDDPAGHAARIEAFLAD